jgi:hypothetical protein
MKNLVENLLSTAVKKHDKNGNPVYRIPVQPILDASYNLKGLKGSIKACGGRFIQNGSKFTLQSFNLRADLEQLLRNTEAHD